MLERRLYPFQGNVSFGPVYLEALVLTTSLPFLSFRSVHNTHLAQCICFITHARLNNSHIYHTIAHDTKNRGIDVKDVSINLPNMLKAKNDSVKALTSGIEGYLFKKYGVEYIKGGATFNTANKIDIKLNDGGETQLEAKNVLIATGSEVTPFPGIEIDEERIVSSTGALDLKEIPKKVGLVVASPFESGRTRVADINRWWSSEEVSSVSSSVPCGAVSARRLLL